jgi:Flp pilus assembly protein TadD
MSAKRWSVVGRGSRRGLALRLCLGACLALVLVAGLGAPPLRAQLSEDYRFQGTVVGQDGKPIPSVQVILHDRQAGTRIVFVTNEDGTFDRRMIPCGVYEASFDKTGFVGYTEHFDWSAMSAQTSIKIAHVVLEKESDRARRELGVKAAKLYEDAYAALVAGDAPTALKKANELLVLGAGNYEFAVRFVIARSLAMQGERDSAAAEYNKVLTLKPDLFEAHFDLAGVLEQLGKPDDALAAYRRAAELKPTDAETQYNIGAILLREKQDYDQAKTYLAKAVELNPAHSQAIKALGFANLWATQTNIEEGVRLLKRYLELEPQAGDAAQIREIVKSFEPAPASK